MQIEKTHEVEMAVVATQDFSGIELITEPANKEAVEAVETQVLLEIAASNVPIQDFSRH